MKCKWKHEDACNLFNTDCNTMDCKLKKINRLPFFQQDLKAGLTIAEACTKHNISFEFAVLNMKTNINTKPEKKRFNPVMQYITHRKGTYFLRKHTDGKGYAFGSYSSLEDAIAVREYCKKHGWYKEKLDDYCRELGITRVQKKRGRY